jgi:hypothetical protein
MEGFDTMNDAPEKIWIKEGYDSWGQYGDWYRDNKGGGIEYTRSDIAQHLTVLPQEQFDKFLAACGEDEPINWREDCNVIVEDDEPQIGRDYE